MESVAIWKMIPKVRGVSMGAGWNQLKCLFPDSIAEFDLLSVALSGMENFNNGGDELD